MITASWCWMSTGSVALRATPDSCGVFRNTCSLPKAIRRVSNENVLLFSRGRCFLERIGWNLKVVNLLVNQYIKLDIHMLPLEHMFYKLPQNIVKIMDYRTCHVAVLGCTITLNEGSCNHHLPPFFTSFTPPIFMTGKTQLS